MKTSVLTIAKYTLIEAVRNRLFALMVISLICIFGLVQFIGELAITETQQIQSAIMGLILRLLGVFLISLFVISGITREFHDKTIETIISLPVPRHVYFTGKYLGFFYLVLIVSILLGLPLLLYSEPLQVLVWLLSLICELIIVTGLCLLCTFTLERIPVTFITVMAFYLLARSINIIQLMSRSPIVESPALSQKFINSLIDIIDYILPELDYFTQTEWLVYSTADLADLSVILIQTVIYAALLSGAALFDLYRKNF